MTDFGQRIFQETGADKWVYGESEMTLDKTEGKDQFEIQAIAFEHAFNFDPSQELLARMRASAFDKGLSWKG